MSIFRLHNKEVSFIEVAEKQLEKHMDAIISLRDYDEGKKDISTRDIERDLPDLRVA